MMSYLTVILSLEKLDNRLHKNKKTDWNEDKQLDTKTKKNIKKQHCLLSMLDPQIQSICIIH